MQHSQTSRLRLIIIALLIAAALAADHTAAPRVIKLSAEASLELATDGPSPFVVAGNASHLGRYICYGEIEFSPGAEAGSLEGEGVAAIQAANGDVIVGIVTWQIDADGNGQIAFHWSDSVEFSDGTVVSSTGRFTRSRPAGAVSNTTSIKDGTSNTILFHV